MKTYLTLKLGMGLLLATIQLSAAQTFTNLGVYVGNPARASFEADMASFKTAMGQPKTIDSFVDYTIPITSWVSNATSEAGKLSTSPSAHALIPIVSVGLADKPTASPGGKYNKAAAVAQMNAIAAGTYDYIFQGIFQTYKSHGFPMIYVRIGWEMNGPWEPWYATQTSMDGIDAATAFTNAFRHVATMAHNLSNTTGYPTMKTVWCPTVINWVEAPVLASGSYPGVYPGDTYVDVIAPDCYSPCRGEDKTNWTTTPPTNNGYGTWAEWAAVPGNRDHYWDYPNATFYNQASAGGWGMKASIALALTHNKPFGLSETGAGPASGSNNADYGPADEGRFPLYLADRLSSAIAQGLQIEFVTVWDYTPTDGGWKFSDGSKPNELVSWQQFVQTMALATSPLPGGKTDADIGSPSLAGSGSASGSVYTVKGAGTDIYNTSDQFNYVEQALTGNQTLITRVTGLTNTNSSAKGGVMFRLNNNANSPFVMEAVTPAGYVEMVFRTAAGGSAAYTGAGSGVTTLSTTTPVWLKLVKSGSNFNGYYATTVGTPATADWHALGSLYLSTFTNYLGGLAVTSHNTSALATGKFDNVSP